MFFYAKGEIARVEQEDLDISGWSLGDYKSVTARAAKVIKTEVATVIDNLLRLRLLRVSTLPRFKIASAAEVVGRGLGTGLIGNFGDQAKEDISLTNIQYFRFSHLGVQFAMACQPPDKSA